MRSGRDEVKKAVMVNELNTGLLIAENNYLSLLYIV